MRARRTFAALALTVSLAVAGCSGGISADDKSESAAKPAARGEGAAGPAADTPASGAKGGQTKPVSVAPSHIIRTAELEVEVKDAEKALAAARRAARDAGGHVADEKTERADGTRMTSRIVLRVPQEKYDEVLSDSGGRREAVVAQGRCQGRHRPGRRRAEPDRHAAGERGPGAAADGPGREARRRGGPGGQLSNRQAELESLLAQQAALRDSTTLATITLSLSETEPEEKKQDDEPGFLDALGGGWDALTATVRWVGVVIGAVAPFAAGARPAVRAVALGAAAPAPPASRSRTGGARCPLRGRDARPGPPARRRGPGQD